MTVPLIGLAACGAPALGPQTPTDAAAVTAPFDVPMDPGLIRCAQISNPAALAAATDWAMGQARAGLLSGRTASLPDAADLSSNLASYCSANRGDTIRAATAQIGI